MENNQPIDLTPFQEAYRQALVDLQEAELHNGEHIAYLENREREGEYALGRFEPCGW